MLTVILGAIVSVVLAGLLIKWILNVRASDAQITWQEFGIGVAACILIMPFVAWAGWAMARENLMTFTEYWNGWEVSVNKLYTTCTRDGSCRWDYDCDPYFVTVCESCNCDRKGNCQTCCHQEIRYHSCPYVTTEYHYSVSTTLGGYEIASHVFPDNPQAHRWRVSESIPQSVISSAGVGDPPFWVAARDRCQANQPGPVTARRDYKNYILASDHTYMKEHSSDVEDYQKRQLLPPLAHSVQSFYHADKVSFVGWQPANRVAWENALEHLDASLGSQLQGDLHVVVIKNDFVADNPERYAIALKAYWQNKDVFAADSFSKNGIVVLIGTADGTTVSYSRGFTGMPLGNEKLIAVLRDGLKGLSLTPEVLIGPATSHREGGKVVYPPDGQSSALSRLLWGVDDPATKFKRISMSGKDGQGGFLYLKNEIQPTSGQRWGILIVTFLIGCGVWLWAGLHEDQESRY